MSESMTEPRRDEVGEAAEIAPEPVQTDRVERREAVFELQDVRVSYDGVPAVRDIAFDVYRNKITALIGPSGCGKSTLIRCLNRMNDLIASAKVEGRLL